MDTTFKFFLKKQKEKADGTTPIYLRITENRKYIIKATGISIQEKHWNQKGQEVRKSHPSVHSLNTILAIKKKEAEELLLTSIINDENITKQEIKNSLVRNEAKADLFEYFETYLASIREKHWYRFKKIQNVYFKLKAFTGRTELPFNEFNKSFLISFVEYLETVDKNKPITIKRILSSFKMVITDAIDKKVFKEEKSPFILFKYSASGNSTKTKLTIEQIKAIHEINLEHGSGIWHHRNEFLFSFYTAGIRFGDLCMLKWKDITDGYLVYVMSKTINSKPIARRIKLVRQALEILELYRSPVNTENTFIFPELQGEYTSERELKAQISSRNALANKHLKKVAKLAGIESTISFHVSRHSYADFARTKGLDLYQISKALGHSKLETTQVYLKSIDQQYVDKGHESLFE